MTAATTVWQSTIKYISDVEQGAASRGLIEHFPRRIDREKLVANLARQLLAATDDVPEHLLLFTAGDRIQTSKIKSLLPEINHLELCSDIDDDLLALFEQPNGHYLSVSVCASSSHYLANLQDAAKSLQMFIPDLHQEATQMLNKRLELLAQQNSLSTVMSTGRMVIEDHLHKFVLTDLEGASVRSMARVLRSATAPSRGGGSIDAPIGAGFLAKTFRIASTDDNKAKTFQAAFKRIRLNTPTHSFDNLPLVAFAATQWLREIADAGLNELRCLQIMAPYAPVALQLLRLFDLEAKSPIDRAIVDLDQFIFGWQHNLACMRLLDSENLPSLIVKIDQFPIVDLVAVW